MLQTSFLFMKSLNKTETSIFLSVVCSLFPKAIFLTFIGSRYLNTYPLPILVYGLEVVLPRKTLMEQIDTPQEISEADTLIPEHYSRSSNLCPVWYNTN